MEAPRNVLYKPTEGSTWTGRIDGDEEAYLRWHQKVECINLNEEQALENSLVILGFCCDEGVRRNQGRVGAKDGPAALRKVLGGLPVLLSDGVRLIDAGDVICMMESMEEAQAELSDRVAQILKCGGFPVVLGGGHEVTYGHYNGVKQALGSKVGIINLDAHLDIRELNDGKGNSGTGFYQIAEDAKKEGYGFHYLALGIQDISNTRALFNYAKQEGAEIIWVEEFVQQEIEQLKARIETFAKKVDHIYLTIDLDVFAACCAPGVSAVAFNGLFPDYTFQEILRYLFKLDNLRSVDIAELNPLYDLDNRTTKLAADLLFKLGRKF